MRRPPIFVLPVAVLVAVVLIGAALWGWSLSDANLAAAVEPRSQLTLEDIPIDGARAYEYLKQLCELGPRTSGSPGMAKQQKLLEKHFTDLGGKVSYQPFRVRHPLDGSLVSMSNLLVSWNPEAKQRILICAHYDTRPLPDRDPNPQARRQGVFLGANDGASGTALLMELAHHMPQVDSKYGVDFALFDGEEFVWDNDRDPYFLGSEWFARKYAGANPPFTYRWGVLVDMIGDKDLQLFQERNSMFWADTRPLVIDIWKTAERLGVNEFIPRRKHEIRDDHLPLRNIGKIPTCDIIDFDYPRSPQNAYWHTTADTPDKCSGLSLAKVGWVLIEWLESVD